MNHSCFNALKKSPRYLKGDTSSLTLILYALVLLITVSSVHAASPWEITKNTQQTLEFTVQTSWDDLVISKTDIQGDLYTRLAFPTAITTKQVGAPELPIWSTLIEIPGNSICQVKIINETWEEKSFKELDIHYPIFPAQESVSKTGPAPDFALNKTVYATNQWFAPKQVRVETQGTVRGRGIALLRTKTMDYQPVEKKLRLCKQLHVRIDFVDKQGKATTTLCPDVDKNPLFNPVYGKLINFPLGGCEKGIEDDQVRYPITYLLVAPENLQGNAKLDEFITWKEQKGFDVITNYISSTATTTDVDNWIETQYNNITPHPCFVLLVGDESGTYTVPAVVNPSSAVTRTDLQYGVMGTVTDANNIPSMYVGRFSVQSLTDLEAQIDKTLWYEKNQFFVPTPDLDYLRAPMGAAGADSTFGTSHGNPQIAYGWNHYFTATNGMDQAIHYLHPTAASMDSQIISHISDGVSLYNYTAHGSETSFGDPSFTISNVNSLTNENEYPLVIGNCCLTGSYGTTECFGEAWLNAPNKGAIGYIGASMSTLWDEDLVMGVGTIDAMNDQNPPLSLDDPGMYDGWMNGWSTVGGGKQAGLLAVNRFASSYTHNYWLSYTTFGDPSLSVFFGAPSTISATYPNVFDPGTGTFTVMAPTGVYVAASSNGQVLDAGLTNATGTVNLTIPPSITTEFTLTLTGANYQPIIDTITVGNLDRPYVVPSLDSVANNISGQTAQLDILFRNLGSQDATSVQTTFSTTSPYVTDITGPQSFGAISSTNQLLAQDALFVELASTIPDGQTIQIDYTATVPGYDPVTVPLEFTVNAPMVSSTLIANYIEASNELQIALTIENTGNAPASNLELTLSSSSSQVTSIPSPTQQIASLTAGVNTILNFTMNLDPAAVTPYLVQCCTAISGDNIETENTCRTTTVGITDDFESGTWKPIWTHGGDANWQIVSNTKQAGSYVAKAGTITHSQTSSISLLIEAYDNAEISFDVKVSSEVDYDGLVLYSDDTSLNIWTGNVSWTSYTQNLSPGEQQITFTYVKDSSVSSGDDTAWIDNVLLTNASIITPFNLHCSTNQLDISCSTNQHRTLQLGLTNLGTSNGSVNLSVTTNDSTSIMNEDFETAPNDWSITAASGTTGQWTHTNSRDGDSLGTGYFMIADSDALGSSAMDTTMTSPQFTIPANHPVTLEFDHYFRYYSDPPEEKAQAYLIENGNWTQIWGNTTASEGSWSTPTHFEQTFSYPSQTDLQVAFRYYDANYDWYWAVDNVKLSESQTPWCNCDGSLSMDIAIDAGNTVQVPINFDSTGMAAGVYNLTLQLTTSTGTVTQIPITMTVSTPIPENPSNIFILR